MIYGRLIAVAVLFAAVVGGYLYVQNLRNKIGELTVQAAQLSKERDYANAQVLALTTAAHTLAERASTAEALNTQVRADLSKARARTQIITIPSDCQGALDVLTREVAQ